jgi:Tol biopolymer transport system component
VTLREPRTEVVLIGVQAERGPVPISGTIAYIANRNAWVIQTTSPNQRRLTHAGDLDGRVFALSPDGSYLLYTRRVVTESDELVPINTLWMIETAIAGAEPIQLEADNILWADWEPDCDIPTTGTGCSIAYSTGTPSESSPGWKAENDLWVARPRPRDGQLLGQRRVVAPTTGGPYGWWGTAYAWSPDKRSLAYARADEVGVIRAYDGAQTTLARFAPYRTYAPWAWRPTVSWSPEGASIVTTLHGPAPTGEEPDDSPVFDVWVLAADGTITAELVSEAGMWAAPIYAPAGDHVAFGHARSPYASQTSGYDIYLIDRDGSDRRQLFPPVEEIGLEYPEMTWGPGGEELLIIYQGNLYLVPVEDGEVRQLTDESSLTAVRWRW